MLKKQQRLPRFQFREVFAEGKRIQGLNTTLIVSKDTTFKCSVVVSKKVAKKAHDRNRIRRRLYTLVGELISLRPLALALIIVVKPVIMKLNKSDFREILKVEIGRGFNNR